MKHSIIYTFLVISATAFAQQVPSKTMANAATTPQVPQPLANDPAAPVPTVAYRSVFKETSLGLEKETVNWRKANDEVGKFLRIHVDILKWEEQQRAQETAKTVQNSVDKVPSTPAPAPAPVTQTKPASAHKH